MTPSRRLVLTGSVAGVLAPTLSRAAQGGAGRDADLRALLDALEAPGPAADRLARLDAFPVAGLSAPARLDRDGARIFLAVEARREARFPFDRGAGPYAVSPRAGAWRKAVAALAAGEADGAAEAVRADSVRVRDDAARGVVPPRFAIEATGAELDRVASACAVSAPLAAALAEQAAALRALLPRAGEGAGVSRFPDGEAYYALKLEAALGEPMSGADAHARALEAAHRLSAEADVALKAQGLSQGSVGERLRALARDPRHLYADDDRGRDEAVADMNRWLDAARARLPGQFAFVPPEAAAARVWRMAPDEAAAGKAGYRKGPTARPGDRQADGYYVDLHEIRRRPRWTLPSVVHHETLPGHFMQLALQARSGAHPLRLRAAPGFIEGWAIYAERLSDAAGAFAADPLARIGYLRWMLFRVGRVLVDTGVHHAGWTRERALALLPELQGDPAVFAPFAQDVERICLEPGAAAGQGLAALEFERMRREAQAGPAPLTLAAFHAALLDAGAAPLSLLPARLRRA